MLVIIGIILLFIADILIKRWAGNALKDGNSITLLNGNLRFNLLYNEGAAMGILGTRKRILNVVTVTAVLLIAILIPDYIKKGSLLEKLGITVAAAGAFNNSYERIVKKKVTDYISFPKLAFKKIKDIVFNLSDFLIMIGAVILSIGGRFNKK